MQINKLMLQMIRTFCQERVSLTAPFAWEVLPAAVPPRVARSAVSAPLRGTLLSCVVACVRFG
jgi:hypothetical protein